MTEVTICTVPTCSRPSQGWFVCRVSADIFEHEVLGQVGWLLEDLDLVIAGQVRYGTQVGGKSSESRLPVNLTASDARGRLLNELDTAARLIAEANGIEAEYRDGATAAAWLAYRISMIRLHPAGGQIIEDITREFAGAHWVVDRPRAKQYLGDCKDHERVDDLPECPGSIYAYDGKPEARCDTCGSWWDKDQLREWLISRLDDHVLSAAEIARMSVYLGLDVDRSKVRKQINQWHVRGRLRSFPIHEGGRTVDGFLFGEVKVLLARLDRSA